MSERLDALNAEWHRSNPDIVVYLPEEGKLNDGDNEHFLVFESHGGDLLAMKTGLLRKHSGRRAPARDSAITT